MHGARYVLAAGLLALGVGCGRDPAAAGSPGTAGGGGMSGTGGTGAGNTGGVAATTLYAPCPPAQRLGGFTVELLATDGFTNLSGSVRDRVDPRMVWTGATAAPGCALVTGPVLTCPTACTSPLFCAGNNACIAEPVNQNLGGVTVTGVGPTSIDVTRITSRNTYYTTLMDPFPPFAPGATVTLAAAGAGAAPSFSLQGRGIEPLVFVGTGILIGRAGPLDLTWTAPTGPAHTKISIVIDIGHHGGIAARIECHVDDSGRAQVPTALVNALIDKGTAGYPSIVLTRRTVDSTAVGAGCVDFAIASSVERIVMVEGVTSCANVGSGEECPSGQLCGADLKCG